jgi:long-chain acyl-CoA synthetase
VRASLADLLFAPDEPATDSDIAVIDDDKDTSHGELTAMAQIIASTLDEAGVRPGSPVAVCMADGAPLIAALFGVWRAGCVYVPINPRLTDTERSHIFGSVKPAGVLERSADGEFVLTAVAASPAHHDADMALVQMTSGTTGRPKPVLLRHAGVLDLMDSVLSKIRSGKPASTRAPMPNLIPVSLSLWAGIYNVLFAFRVGAPVVVMGGFDTARFATLVERYGIASTVLPPAAMTMLTDDPAIRTLSPLRFVRSITAPLSPLQARRFHDKFGIAVLNSYGQTELGGEIIGWNAADSREFGPTKLGALGRPHDGVDVRVDASTGEIQVRTPSMSAGYADGADLADRITPDGWFRTGDIGSIDDEGFVWIDGRVSEMINRGGLKVFPGEVEEVLRLAPAIAEVAVVGAPDTRIGEVPVAFVVPHRHATIDAQALEELSRTHLAPYKVPVRFVVLDALPRNEVGKVLSRRLLERL